jgi:hypothetical protein
VGRRELPFVRPFARSFVRLSSCKKENDNVEVKKSNDEGKKEQNERTGRKYFLWPIGV